jgi:hypothetical protein
MGAAKAPSKANLLDRLEVRLIEPQEREEFDRRLKVAPYLHQPIVTRPTRRYIAAIDDQPVSNNWIGWSPRQRAR